MTRAIALFGVESIFTPELMETARRCGYTIAVSVIAGDPEWDMPGLRPVRPAEVSAELLTLPYAVPWVTPGLRHAKHLEALATGFRDALTLIDSTAVVAGSAQLGPGSYINCAASLGAYATLGTFGLINRNASVGHHTVCGPFVSIGPGATVAARCRIGKGTMIGAGAIIAPGVTTGDNCLVMLGAVLTKDLSSNCVAAGNPARVTGRGFAGYKGSGVP